MSTDLLGEEFLSEDNGKETTTNVKVAQMD